MSKETHLVFNRSNAGTKRKFDEAIKILEYSVMLVHYFDLKEFNNVIAGQLRLLLCDTSKRTEKGGIEVIIDNSLLRKINSNPKLYPVLDFIELEREGNAFTPDPLFDYTKPPIDLNTWLNQVIYKIKLGENLHKVTIFDFIKEYANKSGGAHLDSSLPEKSLVVDVHSERVLTSIARGLFRSLGRDFDQQSHKNLTYILQKLEEAKASE